MRIDGQWLLGGDGVMRPMIGGEILAGNGSWERSEFLVDTGADRIVFSAVTLAKLGLQPLAMEEGISGVGGIVDSVIVATPIQFTREDAGNVVFRGQYVAVTELEALDINVLGHDITDLFAVQEKSPSISTSPSTSSRPPPVVHVSIGVPSSRLE